MRHVPIMGTTTGGVRGVQSPKFGQTPNVAFWWGSGVGNRLHQTGYTFLNFFSREGQCNTSDQEIGPPNFENVVAPLVPTAWLVFLSHASHMRKTSQSSFLMQVFQFHGMVPVWSQAILFSYCIPLTRNPSRCL